MLKAKVTARYRVTARTAKKANLTYEDLPDFIQGQVDRELAFEFNIRPLEQEPEDLIDTRTDLTFEFNEYDPAVPQDREILQKWLDRKVEAEGEPDHKTVDEIGRDGVIDDPILVLDNTCREGRHRLAAALQYGIKIQAYEGSLP